MSGGRVENISELVAYAVGPDGYRHLLGVTLGVEESEAGWSDLLRQLTERGLSGVQLVIADEPTTALDVTIQAQILELLREMRAKSGMALLLITHDLGVVAEMASRVVVMYAGCVVEEAPVESLFARPTHPYTEGLLAAVPRLGAEQERLTTIPGTVPAATDWPSGCRFRERCAYAFDRCVTDEPTLVQVGPAHRAACHLVDAPERRVSPSVARSATPS